MIWNLEPGWLMMAVALVAVLAFFFGSALDAIMRDDGFGPTGNMLLFTIGFFMAVIIANTWGISLRDLKLAVAWGLGGAFTTVSLLALIKAASARI
jgi:fluoride ion exporter CrcB/FEX